MLRVMSIKRKLTYLYVPMLVVPLVLFAAISHQINRNIMVDRALDSIGSNTEVLANQLDDLIADTENCASYLTIGINNIVNHLVSSDGPGEEIKRYTLISNELSYAKLIFESIDSIAFIDTAYRVYYTDQELVQAFPLFSNVTLLHDQKASRAPHTWYPMAYRAWMTKNKSEPVMTLGKEIWNINTGKTIGYLFINVSEASLSKNFVSDHVDFFLVDDQRSVVASNDKTKVLTPALDVVSADILSKGGKSQWIDHRASGLIEAKATMSSYPLTLIAVGDLSFFESDMASVSVLILVILSSFLGLVLILSWFTSRWITAPIHVLYQGVEKLAQGDLDTQIDLKNHDEIGLVAQRFNSMGRDIKNLIAQVKVDERQKLALESALLQEQIKPHFLYNTLDIISKLIEMQQHKKARKALVKLAAFYRSSLADGRDLVTVSEELAMTEAYLSLQKIRYGDLFTFDIEVEDACTTERLPKLTLQPLVENAIYHGLKYIDQMGYVKITVSNQANALVICISNNGIMIDPLRLRALQEALKQVATKGPMPYFESHEGGRHFGLTNVANRLSLLLNGKGYLEVKSESSETQVFVILERTQHA